MEIPLPINLTTADSLYVPGDPRPIKAPWIRPMVNGHGVRGVQRLEIYDQGDDRIVRFHVHPRFGNFPVQDAATNLHVEIIFAFNPEEPAGVVTLIDGALTHDEQVDGRDVWMIRGLPA